MRRDQLKILLSGILVLLLGSLIVYSYLFREEISRFLKKKETEEVVNNSKTDRVILSPEINSEPPISPNDLNTLPTEEKKAQPSGEFSANEKETSKETKTPPGSREFSSDAKETQPTQDTKTPREEWPEERKTRSAKKTPKDKSPEEKWNPPEDETRAIQDETTGSKSKKEKIRESQGDWETKADYAKKKHRGKKSRMKKHTSLKTGKKIRSLETRVDRLERKLGISHTKKKRKTHGQDRSSLEKRVRNLETEMEKLKTKE
ncbi:hypothetical protein LEP1GSC060_0280 [Leptospira weilii serovar Ranarum str. ICFT]|uniref:Uncharacterized protein n=1 Tax=Leptospira weilii serovar Ranarum str. ICFT TaxID=1218598 RepID=N1WH42_9LEPT|nr:hypothetical protein [Leptospira weilii]EMY76434.1 hypothetical protein LEP1GSC060_0280 [Leptospira weilii serovar Ranarum str. ICFT]